MPLFSPLDQLSSPRVGETKVFPASYNSREVVIRVYSCLTMQDQIFSIFSYKWHFVLPMIRTFGKIYALQKWTWLYLEVC